ncbi:MAG: hypothetical protein LBL85_05080 [Methanocalculaceae archaeon]|jgi:hypothetical protein|nr:hypothetical protein [Methanocalculaceae archaeon]
MARTAQETSTSVNFRMPDSILKHMDKLAAENNHDRIAEINGACRHWISIGGNAAADITTFQKIAQLEKTITELSAETAEMKENFLLLEKQITGTLDQIERERELLLKIIQSNENTIKLLLTASLKEKSE